MLGPPHRLGRRYLLVMLIVQALVLTAVPVAVVASVVCWQTGHLAAAVVGGLALPVLMLLAELGERLTPDPASHLDR